MNIYISIGNSDDKLSQAEWCNFIHAVRHLIVTDEWDEKLQIHGEWFSRPDSPYQNAIWCAELKDVAARDALRERLLLLAVRFRQDAIAWAVAETELITPAGVA